MPPKAVCTILNLMKEMFFGVFTRRTSTALFVLCVGLGVHAHTAWGQQKKGSPDIETLCENAVRTAKLDISSGNATSSKTKDLAQCVTTLKKMFPGAPALVEPAIQLGILFSMQKGKKAAQEVFSTALEADLSVQLPSAAANSAAIKENFELAVLALPNDKQKERAIRLAPPKAVTKETTLPSPQKTEVKQQPAVILTVKEPETEVAEREEIDVDVVTSRWVPRIRVRFTNNLGDGITWLRAKQGSDGKSWSGQIPKTAAHNPLVTYTVEAMDPNNAAVLATSGALSVKVRPPAAEKALASSNAILPVLPAKKSDISRFFVNIGAGSSGMLVPGGMNTDVAWYFQPTSETYAPVRTTETGIGWAGVHGKIEFGGFASRNVALSVIGKMQAYLPNNVESAYKAQSSCLDDQGRPRACYALVRKDSIGFMILGRIRYQFRASSYFQPYLFADLGGGSWRATQNIDSARPQKNGQYDPNSPYQLTDVCSATHYGGSSSSPCGSLSGKAGYNAQNPLLRNPPGNLNRVCTDASCMDTVSFGNFFLGAGAGFYLGGKHVGIFAEFSVLGAIRPTLQSLMVDVQIGPQFRF